MAGTVFNGCIYVIGGTDDYLREGLKTVEKYDPFTNEWEVITPMHTGRGALGNDTLLSFFYVLLKGYSKLYHSSEPALL